MELEINMYVLYCVCEKRFVHLLTLGQFVQKHLRGHLPLENSWVLQSDFPQHTDRHTDMQTNRSDWKTVLDNNLKD